MAKLRTNYQKGASGGMIARVGIFAAILSGLVFLFNRFSGNTTQPADNPKEDVSTPNFDFLPAAGAGQVLYNPYFALAYNEEHEQAEWVAYKLVGAQLEQPWVDRSDNFLPDPQVKSKSATPYDYKNSGYDRGHLVPAADMAFSEDAMQYTFLMSNISPQSKNFNKGIWRELEELVRTWAKQNTELYVVTGPVLTQQPKGAIGENGVSIPTAFYKVLLDMTEPQLKGIGFVIPNEVSYDPLYKFAVSIDEVEELTQIDFFPDWEAAATLEKAFNLDLWEFSKKKYELRTQKWNKE